MQGIGRFLLVLSLLCLSMVSTAQATVYVGSPAPEFCLPASEGDKVCLKDYKDKNNVVLLFYILDFTRG